VIWIETKTDKEAQELRTAIWDPVVSLRADGGMIGRSPGPVEAGGEFWYETLRRDKDDPARRYDIARRHLPLPAAWREMAIALRAMIKQARNEGLDFEDRLRELHQLASIWSFSDPAPSGRAGAGYGVIEMTPYAKLAALDLAWDKIGCDELSLLNQADRKLMRQLWGEPAQHATAHDLYREFFDRQARKIAAAEKRRQRERQDRYMAEIDAILSEEQARVAPSAAPEEPVKPRGFLARLFGPP
jgi:hypothetical protein